MSEIRQEQTQRRIFRPKAVRTLTIVVLIAAFLLYWLAARAVQGINLSLDPPQWLGTVRNTFPLFDTFFPALYFVSEMFHWSVIRHFIPLILGVGFAYNIALDLVHQLYDLPERADARHLLSRLRGRIPPFQRPLRINRPRFSEQRVEEELLLVGGPGQVALAESDVAVTEINGRFERVLPPGRRRLRRFEKIIAVLDLREQERFDRNVTLVTKEGLELTTDVFVNFRLQGRSEDTGRLGYSVNDEAVRKATYNVTNFEFGLSRWDSAPLPIASGVLRGIVSKMKLQDLIDPNQAIEGAPHPGVQRDMERTTRGILRGMGIELLEARITSFKMSDTMRDTLVDYYKGFMPPRPALGPVDPNTDGAATRRKRMRDKMIKSIASGMENLRTDRTVMPRSTMRHLSQREALGQSNQWSMMQMMGVMQMMIQQIPASQTGELAQRLEALQRSVEEPSPLQITANEEEPLLPQETIYDESFALDDEQQRLRKETLRLREELNSLDEF